MCLTDSIPIPASQHEPPEAFQLQEAMCAAWNLCETQGLSEQYLPFFLLHFFFVTSSLPPALHLSSPKKKRLKDSPWHKTVENPWTLLSWREEEGNGM